MKVLGAGGYIAVGNDAAINTQSDRFQRFAAIAEVASNTVIALGGLWTIYRLLNHKKT